VNIETKKQVKRIQPYTKCDRVNHDILMARVARKIKDKRILKLILSYLAAGVMINGVIMITDEGTPQGGLCEALHKGGPLSPLLANIILDDLDKELEKRGHKFVGYADDCNIYVKSKRAAPIFDGYPRVMESITAFLKNKLKLRVNEQKSAVDRPWKRKFLGFSMYIAKDGTTKIRIAPQSIDKVKNKIREITSRSNGHGITQRKTKHIPWRMAGYFALSETPSKLEELDGWIRRRLRMCLWKQWKKVKTRYRELRNLKLPEWAVHKLANARKGYWRMSGVLNTALNNAYWQGQGLMSLVKRYHEIRKAWRTAVY
jgi:hypothetical protein